MVDWCGERANSSKPGQQPCVLDSRRLQQPLPQRHLAEISAAIPGLALATLLAAVCTFAAASGERWLFATPASPVSPVLVAIVVGALLGNVLRWPTALAPGLRFAATGVLRTGIALIGLRLALLSLGALSLRAAPIVVGCLAVAALVIPRLCRWLGVSSESALLLTVGTAICGCTAVLAVAPIVRASAAQTGYALATVMLLGLCGVLAYPFLAHALFAQAPIAAGFFLGTAIHDTSQVVGGGLLYAQQFHSPPALAAATVAKLLRNLSLAIVVPALAWRAARGQDSLPPAAATPATCPGSCSGSSPAPRCGPPAMRWRPATFHGALAGNQAWRGPRTRPTGA